VRVTAGSSGPLPLSVLLSLQFEFKTSIMNSKDLGIRGLISLVFRGLISNLVFRGLIFSVHNVHPHIFLLRLPAGPRVDRMMVIGLDKLKVRQEFEAASKRRLSLPSPFFKRVEVTLLPWRRVPRPGFIAEKEPLFTSVTEQVFEVHEVAIERSDGRKGAGLAKLILRRSRNCIVIMASILHSSRLYRRPGRGPREGVNRTPGLSRPGRTF